MNTNFTKPFHKCRLCLKLGDFCSLFEQDESVRLCDMVMFFANIQIFEGDGLSDRVCSSCIENLSTAYLFKQQCERIDALMRQPRAEGVENIPHIPNYDNFLHREFHIHNDLEENEDNSVNDVNKTLELPVNETSDDSDIESIKCVYCSESYNNMGPHKCNVTCTIEQNEIQRASSEETLVARDSPTVENPFREDCFPCMKSTSPPSTMQVPCVLCDEKYDNYDSYVIHVNKCTTNVKLHHYVCPVCHEIYTDKLNYLNHLKNLHFRVEGVPSDPGIDCIDSSPIIEKVRRPKSVRRIGWSIEDIYQEIDCVRTDEKTPTSSPIKNFLSKLGNESSSKQSTPKKVSFRKFIENGKAKTSVYLPFRKFVENYKQKKANYSPIKGKLEVTSKIKATFPETSDSDYNSPGGTSEESWKMKQYLICACDKKMFMLSEFVHDRDRLVAMINELGGVVAENTKMEMSATHFIAVLPNDTFTGMMVCALATGKWLLHVNYIYDSFRGKKFLAESLYEWIKHPKVLEIDNTSVEVAKAAQFWQEELSVQNAKRPFEGKQVVLIMKKKYRQYYQMIFKTINAKSVTYDPRTPGSCCSADYCFVDMKIIERVKLRFFARHNVPVFPYQYILVYLLNRGRVDDEHKYLLQDCKKIPIQCKDTVDFLNSTF